jgi:hypothetical protein
VLLVIKVVEPVGRIWGEEEDAPEADVLFTVIILEEEPVNKKASMSIYSHTAHYRCKTV